MSDEHQRASELLPWYVNATLAGPEAAAVQRHLDACAECQKEVADLQAMMTADDEEAGWRPSPAHFARVMARVDARSQPFWQRAAAWMREAPRPMRIAFALQAAVAFALVAGLSLEGPRIYQTLSRPQVAAAAHARLHVVFAPDITEREMRGLLQGEHAVIVGGPSADGIYTVELSTPIADDEDARKIAQRIAKGPKVRFAAPVAR
jgi:anti-sigma factor RsiW